MGHSINDDVEGLIRAQGIDGLEGAFVKVDAPIVAWVEWDIEDGVWWWHWWFTPRPRGWHWWNAWHWCCWWVLGSTSAGGWCWY